jgi:hypothetical protein
MKNEDKTSFVALMQGVTELYSKKLSPALLDIYWITLIDFDFIDVRKAMERHIVNADNGAFMPKPADLLRYLEGNTVSKSLQAWNKAIRAVAKEGPYLTIVFDDALIHCVIEDMGGWVSFCKVTEEELPFRCREFEKRYSSFLLKPPVEYARHLTGILDQENHVKGLSPMTPVFLGQAVEAERVYSLGQKVEKDFSHSKIPNKEKTIGSLLQYTNVSSVKMLNSSELHINHSRYLKDGNK